MLRMNDIEVRRDGRLTLALDELQLAGDQFTVILGHNGSGKSTLMNLIARQLQPDTGTLQLDGKPLASFSQREFARRVAFLPQRLPDVAGLTVRELVRLGRFPWRGLLGRWQAEDQRMIERAMAQTDVEQYADHLADTLSGGERQRAWIAMLLAQQSPLILLDEPTSALDLAHQYELMTLLRELNLATGRGIVAILHDINLTARYADRIVALKQGRVFFDGSPEELLNNPLLSQLYDIDIELIEQPGSARKIAVVA
ncbi:iron complex transport system ATP-binding protein [Pseudomonas sp. BIGb0408]|uniref:Iron complex transport system ATP-binding protein n=1 Tax=Phytopseudomonas flavescens TaxID=29435 RepID=A0A7Y9XK30_9GAMM|nr:MULTISPECIES: ABC transporter ATP-binding protein [Pseudomonas]MCW2293946.1 iron complex transport system ATP-binding protein [Pseudomonas sp. BIGb0408]NYH71484.1 iron complex transport system ATP-binding protein [Pseudomonas flavescens]